MFTKKKYRFFFQKILYEENGKHSRHVCTFFSILARGLSIKGKQKGYRICPRDKKASIGGETNSSLDSHYGI